MGIKVAPLVKVGRRLVADSFLDPATVSDRSLAPDGYGGSVVTYTARPEQISVALTNARDLAVEPESGNLSGPTLVTVLCPYDVEFADGTRLTVGGRTYEIVARTSADSARAALGRYLAREVS